MEKITKMVEAVVYRAEDGTCFATEEACEEYEESVIRNTVKKLIVFATDTDSLFGDETMTRDYTVEFYRIKNAHDLTVLNQYISLLTYSDKSQNLVPVGAIGNVVGISYSYDLEDAFYIGTIGEYCNRLLARYDTLMPKEE